MTSDLSANAKVGVWDKLWWCVMAVLLLFQEGVQHAHCDTRQCNHKAEDLPRFSC